MNGEDERLIEAYERGVRFGFELAQRNENPPPAILARNVSALGLSMRAMNSLGEGNIKTVSELVACTPLDLRALRNFGDACLKEIRDKLAARELYLAGEEPETTPSAP